MPKYVCSACKKILIRNAADMRIAEWKSYCEETDRIVTLRRLKLRGRRRTDRSSSYAELQSAE